MRARKRATTSCRSTAPEPSHSTSPTATRSTPRSRVTAPMSSTTSRRCRTSASRGTTRRCVLRVNVEGTANVLDAARAADGRVIVVGSAEEYGRVDERDLPLREDAPLRPSTPYGVSKIAASFLALQAHLAYGFDVVRVRAFSHTGPGQSDRFLVPALAQRIAKAERDGSDEIRVGSLDPVRDLSDVRDVVRAYRLIALHGHAGAVYNVCSGTGVSVREITERLVAAAHRPLRVTVDQALVRPVEVPRLVGDASRLRADTGWSPDYSLDETLAAVLDARPPAMSAQVSSMIDRSRRSGDRASRAARRRRAGRDATGAARWRRCAAPRTPRRRRPAAERPRPARRRRRCRARGATVGARSGAASTGSRLAIARSTPRDRPGSSASAARRYARVLEKPIGLAPTCATTRARRTSRCRAPGRRWRR